MHGLEGLGWEGWGLEGGGSSGWVGSGEKPNPESIHSCIVESHTSKCPPARGPCITIAKYLRQVGQDAVLSTRAGSPSAGKE